MLNIQARWVGKAIALRQPNSLRLRRGVAILATGLCAAGVLPLQAQSTYFTETNKTVGSLGAQGTSYYASFKESLGQTCLGSFVYITPERKGLYGQLLVAKLTGRRVSRLDYSQPGGPGSMCNAELVEIAE